MNMTPEEFLERACDKNIVMHFPIRSTQEADERLVVDVMFKIEELQNEVRRLKQWITKLENDREKIGPRT